MKRLIGFLIFIFILVIFYILFINKKINYEVKYTLNNYQIIEKYNKDTSVYSLVITDEDNLNYTFNVYNEYVKSRKNIKKINEIVDNDIKCISINIFKKDIPYICNDSNSYYGYYNESNDELITEINNIKVYNNNYKYYVWNGYGITDLLNNKDYKFLTKESYNNELSYQINNYILFADYDMTREFNKFYVFDIKDSKISTLELNNNISFNSYFLGDYDNKVYLFDKKNNIEYCIDINKKKIEIISDTNGGKIYNRKWEYVTYNNLTYNNLKFDKGYIINYFLKNDNLYYKFIDANDDIIVADNISSIISINDDNVYYLVDDNLYVFNYYNGISKLLNYFEWNFSSNNKIYIFN